jgi:hypothetical protein
MNLHNSFESTPCGRVRRRTFLSDFGMGFTGLALGAMLGRDRVAQAAPQSHAPIPPPIGRSLFAPKAKSVIWIFLSGGYSHLETFDPKPALNKYAGKTFTDTPFENPQKHPLLLERSRSTFLRDREFYATIFPLQVGYRKRGESGIEVADWLPHLGGCVDDIAFVRNMYTTDNDHAAENQIHTGRHKLDETQPSVGAWVSYGLGSLNDSLPEFVVVGGPTRADTSQSIHPYYLGAQYGGVPLALDGEEPLPYGKRGRDVLAEEQRNEYALIHRLNTLRAVEYPQDEQLRARIRSYELAYRMQMAVPETLNLAAETQETQDLYGLNEKTTEFAGRRCLAARRLVERGVRFVQLYPSPYGVWDSHTQLKKLHGERCREIDKPVAGLLKDLKRRGLLDDVVVAFSTEFGRTPGFQTEFSNGRKDGRDHHPHGFTVWFAGAGIKRGYIHGATDELGFHALEPGHYVTDMHATLLHLLGLEPEKLDVPGRKRLDIDRGQVIHDILA